MGKITWFKRNLDITVQHVLTEAVEHVIAYELCDYGNTPVAVGFYYFDDGSIVGETSFYANYVELE